MLPLDTKFHSARLLLLASALVLSPYVLADGHETVESLKAEIAGMEKKFAAVTKDRDSLYDQLLQTIEDLETAETKTQVVAIGRAHILEKFEQQREAFAAEKAELQDEMENLQDDGDFMSERVQQLFAETKSLSAAAEAEQAKMSAEADELARVALVQIQSALAERDAAREELNAAQKATAKVEEDLQSTINGRSYIEGLLSKEKESSASKIAAAEAKAKSAASGRALARKRLVAATDEIAALKDQLANMKNSDGNDSSATGASSSSENAAWANEVNTELSNRYRGISGVSVSELPGNRVGIRIGNAGLFSTGAAQLSDSGRNLLSKLGDALRQQSDARVLVLGHTDNIPVGSNSTYVDNTDLSNRRALAAMKYLGEQVGISYNRMSSTGLADNYPIASNDDAEGRAQNRRIELELTPLQ